MSLIIETAFNNKAITTKATKNNPCLVSKKTLEGIYNACKIPKNKAI